MSHTLLAELSVDVTFNVNSLSSLSRESSILIALYSLWRWVVDENHRPLDQSVLEDTLMEHQRDDV